MPHKLNLNYKNMNIGKDKHSNSENKRFFQSLDWVVTILEKYFSNKLDDEDAEIVEKSLRNIYPKVDEQADLSPKTVRESDKRIRKAVFAHIYSNAKPLLKIHAWTRHAAVAAVFIALVTVSFFGIRHYQSSTAYTAEAMTAPLLETGDAEIKTITLADGTLITANTNTRISFAEKQFNKKNREIWLDGEAFFEVAKNPDKPFIVHSRQLKTTVLGTSFNVKAYPEIGETSVTVREGRVEVAEKDGDALGLLTADKRIVYNDSTRTHQIEDNAWNNDASWQERRLAVNGANIAELTLRLKQLYGVTLIVESGLPTDTRFGLSFRQGAPLTEVMEMIAGLYNISYKITPDKQVIISR